MDNVNRLPTCAHCMCNCDCALKVYGSATNTHTHARNRNRGTKNYNTMSCRYQTRNSLGLGEYVEKETGQHISLDSTSTTRYAICKNGVFALAQRLFITIL